MKTENRELKDVAQEILNNFEWKKRENGKGYYCQKEHKRWITDVCHKAHGDRMPSDDVYEVIVEALERITEAENEDEARDLIAEIEADVYTSNLTDWLGSNNYNIYYLTEALEESKTEDGFKALATAQYLWKQEIAHSILNSLLDKL